MIELKNSELVFRFPDVHPDACLRISLPRTLRIPDDGSVYHLPPGLGNFPLRHVDDFAGHVPAKWSRHGGVMLPMYQSEAMWIFFRSARVQGNWARYPFAIKIAAGKIDAVTGKEWSNQLHRKPQDYVVAPRQPWLDGFCVEKGVIRQFVAMPLGAGYTAEEQITGKAEHGGLQIMVFPMKRKAFEKRFSKERQISEHLVDPSAMVMGAVSADMGLAPGGRMKQEIARDPFNFEDWDLEHSSRCFVHIANSMVWQAITGSAPPSPPPTAKQYSNAGLPWFDYYGDQPALEGSEQLAQLKSVIQMGYEKGDVPLPENESVAPERVVQIREKGSSVVREGWV